MLNNAYRSFYLFISIYMIMSILTYANYFSKKNNNCKFVALSILNF